MNNSSRNVIKRLSWVIWYFHFEFEVDVWLNMILLANKNETK